MSNVAHVTFIGGGLSLPAQTPYDCELLMEHLVERVGRKGVVRVAVRGRVWSVRQIDVTVTAVCARCHGRLGRTWYATTPSEVPHCMRCMFVGLPQASRPMPEEANRNSSRDDGRMLVSESVRAVELRRTGTRARRGAT